MIHVPPAEQELKPFTTIVGFNIPAEFKVTFFRTGDEFVIDAMPFAFLGNHAISARNDVARVMEGILRSPEVAEEVQRQLQAAYRKETDDNATESSEN